MEVFDTRIVAVFLAVLVLALLLSWIVFRRLLRSSEERHERLIQVTREEAEAAARRLRAEADASIEKRRAELEHMLARRELQVEAREKELAAAEQRRVEAGEQLNARGEQVDRRTREIDERTAQLNELTAQYRQRLKEVSGVSEAQAKELLMEQVRLECQDQVRAYKCELLRRSEGDVELEARRILVDCMQRLCAFPQQDATATIVSIPSEDMKGRIIGREGRNIKSFESATGTTLLIDETPDSVLISCFDPVRREVARVALERLIKDGRIHPSSIEQAVEDANEQVQKSVVEFGEDALRRVRIMRVHPEVVQLLGKLRYRLSNNQNSLDHSIEVANLSALLASELGLDVALARRAGLFHDIGKALDAAYEGSHATAGANLLKRVGEDERVVNAVAAHHDEVEPLSIYAAILKIADSVSAVRPGARAESMDSYIQRVRNLEELARSMRGVSEAYALQAGREIRVIVTPDQVSDQDSREMARRLRRRIEDELQYPGTIKITVIRECRFTEQAR